MTEEDAFEIWFERRRQETWLRSCAADRGSTPSTAWSMGLRGYLLEGWMARAAKAESLLTAANAVLAHFMPSFPDSRAVDDCLVGLAAATVDVERTAPELSDGAHGDWLAGAQGLVDACAERRAPETDWRHKAYEWLRAKAAEQEKTNAEYPRHAAEYPSWRDRIVWLRLLADQVLHGRLPIETVARVAAEPYVIKQIEHQLDDCRDKIDKNVSDYIRGCISDYRAAGKTEPRPSVLAAEINALPKRIRDYVHDLISNADPAGDKWQLMTAEQNVAGLGAEIEQLQRELADTRSGLAACNKVLQEERGARDGERAAAEQHVKILRQQIRLFARDALTSNQVNTARIVRAGATAPEICMHNVRLGQGCFCPHCPTASFAHETAAVQPSETYEQIGVLRPDGEVTTYEGCEGEPVYIRTVKPVAETDARQAPADSYTCLVHKYHGETPCRWCPPVAETLRDGKYTMTPTPPMLLVDGNAEPQCNGNCYVIGGGFISDDPACPKHGSKG